MERREDNDRRKVDRFSSPPVREHFKQIAMCLRFLVVLTFSGALYSVINGFMQGGGAVDASFGIFMGFIFGCLTILLVRYCSGIQDFLKNESLGNLDKAMERQAIFWIAASFFALIWVIAFFIYAA